MNSARLKASGFFAMFSSKNVFRIFGGLAVLIVLAWLLLPIPTNQGEFQNRYRGQFIVVNYSEYEIKQISLGWVPSKSESDFFFDTKTRIPRFQASPLQVGSLGFLDRTLQVDWVN